MRNEKRRSVRCLFDVAELQFERQPVQWSWVAVCQRSGRVRDLHGSQSSPAGHWGQTPIFDVLIADMLGEHNHISVLLIRARYHDCTGQKRRHVEVPKSWILSRSVQETPFFVRPCGCGNISVFRFEVS